MKAKIRIFINFLVFLTIAFPFVSCKKVSHNGDLDGNWRIVSIENIEDGTKTKPHQLFIAFQLHVVRLSPNGVAGNLHYNKEDSLVSIDFPYQKDEKGKILLSQYGIKSNPVTFKIEKVSSKQLIIRSSETIMNCEKF